MRTIAVVGASLAGVRAAQELRAQGYAGRLVVVGAEAHQPYDRPPLSKDVLLGKATRAEIALLDDGEVARLSAEMWLGVRAERLVPPAGALVLSTGSELPVDGVVIATGGVARRLPGARGIRGVHVLRTLDDALALRADLLAGATRVAVVGGGFVGAEVASSCHALGVPVTVIEALPVPLSRVLGERIGAVCADLHTDHGVDLRCGVSVAGLVSVPDGAGGRRVTAVELSDGGRVDADVVVVGVGMRPATEWLAGSGIAVDDGVLCDAGCVTRLPNVVAAGDVARYQADATGRRVRHEHWSNAAATPATAVRNLLAGRTVARHAADGYVWSEQYGVRIQFAGQVDPTGEVRFVDGAPADRRFVATYHRDGAVVGVLAFDSPRLFTKLRRQLAAIHAR
ncbi:NAD(P)/FAD-dependent oxidoreductase [Gandjariella thermophila]|uniref:Pyridine nucleotide-disulfide oxidoreductase n=1 Tax=Gandjariella thermophila TaxID=1931992 RepID=A0A4D4J559_9PSEU|nr:FAD-dependent oxidoreductase [Gandjariella thermophila]GDY29676.1 pyridine nucleotide-disulfide oxidoreductase [Gandjariella thermophila]